MKPAITLLAALFTALASSWPVAAQNVLLPPDNPDKGSQPNLGFMPVEPPAASGDSSKTTEPAAALLPDTSLAQSLPVQVQPQATPAAPDAKPYKINIALSRQTAWTPTDFTTISTQMGLSSNEIAHACHMGINGMVITDTGSEYVESNFLTSTTVGYGGAVTNAMLNTYAVCDSAPKPAPHSYMQQVGNKFTISLGSAFCQPAKPFRGTMRQILINHNAAGDSCVYFP